MVCKRVKCHHFIKEADIFEVDKLCFSVYIINSPEDYELFLLLLLLSSFEKV